MSAAGPHGRDSRDDHHRQRPAGGFQAEDILFEGTLGFVTLAAIGYGVYRLVL